MANSSFISKIYTWLKSHPLISSLIFMAITFMVVVWLLLVFLDIWTHHGDDTTVPEIKNLTYAEACDRLGRASLDIEISDSIYDTSVSPGTIVESWPKSGSVVKRGRKVYVTVTAFSPRHVTLSMPITGVSVRQATSYLNAMGINTVRIVDVPSQYPDLVERALYNGQPLGAGSVIPVDANIVLEVGRYVQADEFSDDDTDYSDVSAEEAIYNELSTYDNYYDDEP